MGEDGPGDPSPRLPGSADVLRCLETSESPQIPAHCPLSRRRLKLSSRAFALSISSVFTVASGSSFPMSSRETARDLHHFRVFAFICFNSLKSCNFVFEYTCPHFAKIILKYLGNKQGLNLTFKQLQNPQCPGTLSFGDGITKRSLRQNSVTNTGCFFRLGCGTKTSLTVKSDLGEFPILSKVFALRRLIKKNLPG